MTNKTQSEQNKSAFVLPTKQTLAIARAHPTRVNGSALVLKAAWTLAHLQSFLKHLSEETAYSAGDSAGAARRDRMDSQRHATNLHRSAGREGMAFFPLVFSLLMFILVLNLIGMIPFDARSRVERI